MRRIDIAEGKGFDYFVLTDHNTADHGGTANIIRTKMILLYGVEWTSDKGHANIWSTDHMTGTPLRETWATPERP
jgi:predicted metal-dependent phosphoesterase TrpH